MEEGAADTPSMAFAACDALDIAGKGWEGMGGYSPIVTNPCMEPGEPYVLGKKNISKGAAGWVLCEQTQGPAGNIPLPRPDESKQLFQSHQPWGTQGSLCDTSASLSIHNAGTGLKQNSRATQIVADQHSGPECSPQRTGDTELQRLAGTSSAPPVQF